MFQLEIPTNDEEREFLRSWLENRLPDAEDLGQCALVGVARNGDLLLVIAYHNFRGGNIEVAAAADNPRWASKEAVRFLLSFPFETLKCRRMTALVRCSNERSQRALKRMGFRQEGFHRELFPGEHGLSFGMTANWFKRSKWHERR